MHLMVLWHVVSTSGSLGPSLQAVIERCEKRALKMQFFPSRACNILSLGSRNVWDRWRLWSGSGSGFNASTRPEVIWMGNPLAEGQKQMLDQLFPFVWEENKQKKTISWTCSCQFGMLKNPRFSSEILHNYYNPIAMTGNKKVFLRKHGSHKILFSILKPSSWYLWNNCSLIALPSP